MTLDGADKQAHPSNFTYGYQLRTPLLQNGDHAGARREADALLQLNQTEKKEKEIRQFLSSW